MAAEENQPDASSWIGENSFVLTGTAPRLTRWAQCVTLVHMERIGIRDLHMKTGEWVRRAARGEGVVVTDRGRPVASLLPFREGDAGRSFRDRILLPEFEALSAVPGDSTADVSDDRDRG